MKKKIIYLLTLVSILQVQSKNIDFKDRSIDKIRAIVLDTKTNEPVSFAHVFINQTTCGTYTTIEGVFELSCDLDITKLDLFISHVGYENIIMKIDSSWIDGQTLYMTPSAQQLAEVTILSEKEEKNRKRNLRIFKNEFLGPDKAGKKCFIKNPETIYFEDSLDILRAFADEPIQIVNLLTGYQIEYHLKSFEFDKKTTLPKYSGNCFIVEIDTSDFSLKKKWIDQRETSYNGSLVHFFHSFLSDSLEDDGFIILNKASLDFTIDKKKERSIVSISESIDVQYLNEYEPRTYRAWINRILRNKSYQDGSLAHYIEPRYQITSISPINNEVFINNNGLVSNEEEIVLNGYMGWERVADLLPFGYK